VGGQPNSVSIYIWHANLSEMWTAPLQPDKGSAPNRRRRNPTQRQKAYPRCLAGTCSWPPNTPSAPRKWPPGLMPCTDRDPLLEGMLDVIQDPWDFLWGPAVLVLLLGLADECSNGASALVEVLDGERGGGLYKRSILPLFLGGVQLLGEVLGVQRHHFGQPAGVQPVPGGAPSQKILQAPLHACAQPYSFNFRAFRPDLGRGGGIASGTRERRAVELRGMRGVKACALQLRFACARSMTTRRVHIGTGVVACQLLKGRISTEGNFMGRWGMEIDGM